MKYIAPAYRGCDGSIVQLCKLAVKFFISPSKKFLGEGLLFLLFTNPFLSLAAAFDSQGETVETLFDKIKTLILNPIINFLFVVATLVFLWGVLQYVIAADNTSKTEGAKKQMLWGIIGLAVMSSAWAIVNILTATLK